MKTRLFDILMFLANRVVARTPSHGFRLWFYRRVMGFRIGEKSTIFMDAWLDGRHGFTMGDNSVINQRCRLDNRGGITIGNNVSISAEVCILTADHDLQSPDFAGRGKPVVLEDYVFIGTRALLLPGVTVGRGAAVAAGATVTKNVAPYTIVAGIPARAIGTRTTDLQYNLDYRRFLA